MSEAEEEGHETEGPKRGRKSKADGKLGLYRQLRKEYLEDYKHCSKQHENAKRDFDFKAGEQWADKTKEAMADNGAGPPIVFNMSLSVVMAVAGVEINGRHEVTYLPRGTDENDIIANETLSGTSQWMGDECDAEDEESEAFEEALDCGLGFTESRMDYDEDPDGKYIEEKVSVLEMCWDRRARKKNLQDARRFWRARKMCRKDARDLIDGLGVEVDDDDLHCPWAQGVEIRKDPESVDERREKRDDGKNDTDDRDDDEITIVHAQWVEYRPYYRVAVPTVDPVTQQPTTKMEELEEKDFKALQKIMKKEGTALNYVRQRRKVYKQAFIGGTILFEGDLEKDGNYAPGFTYHAITGHLHKTKGLWYGLVSILRDPQMLVNKTLSKMIHILSTTAQGGILAEKSAFADPAQAQRTFARHDMITLMEDGAIAKGKVMQKPGAGNVAPFAGILEYAVDSLWRVVGTNPEILGMQQRDQPGVLEHQRKQAAMTILAKLFDSLRRFRKNIGRNRLWYIQNFLSDGRIVRILGDDGFRGVKLIRERTLGDYDVIVDDAPTSPNQKEVVFSICMQLLDKQAFAGAAQNPEMVALILEHSPLPRKVVDAFKKLMGKPNPAAEKGQQLEMQGKEAENARTMAQAEQAMANAEKLRAETQGEAILGIARQMTEGAKAEQAKAAMFGQQVKTMAVAHKAARDMIGQPETDAPLQGEPPGVPMPPQLPSSSGSAGVPGLEGGDFQAPIINGMG